jgi:hypothetical protein
MVPITDHKIKTAAETEDPKVIQSYGLPPIKESKVNVD